MTHGASRHLPPWYLKTGRVGVDAAMVTSILTSAYLSPTRAGYRYVVRPTAPERTVGGRRGMPRPSLVWGCGGAAEDWTTPLSPIRRYPLAGPRPLLLLVVCERLTSVPGGSRPCLLQTVTPAYRFAVTATVAALSHSWCRVITLIAGQSVSLPK